MDNYINKSLEFLNSQNNSTNHENIKFFNEKNELGNYLINTLSNEIINDYNLSKEFKYDRNLSITNLYQCNRLVFYDRYKKQLNIDYKNLIKYPYSKFSAKTGETIHDMISNLLNCYDITKQYISIKDYPVYGKFDGIYNQSIIEIKTYDDNNDRYVPNNKDFVQLLIIWYIIKKQYMSKYNVNNNVILFYIGRSNNPKTFKEYHIDNLDFDIIEKTLKPVFENSIYLMNCIMTAKLPDIVNLNDCSLCAYSGICDKTNTTNVSFDKLDLTNINKNLGNTNHISKIVEQNNNNKDNIEWY